MPAALRSLRCSLQYVLYRTIRSYAACWSGATVWGSAGLELEDRITELCNRAIAEKDPVALGQILTELKAALTEYTRATRRMTLLHFDYFRKRQELFPEDNPPSRDENVSKKLRR